MEKTAISTPILVYRYHNYVLDCIIFIFMIIVFVKQIYIYIYLSLSIYIYIYIYSSRPTQAPLGSPASAKSAPVFWREQRGSQGMGVVSNNCFDRVLLSILHIFKPSCRPVFEPPILGTPSVPLIYIYIYIYINR